MNDDTLREKLLERVDYQRFEQEWLKTNVHIEPASENHEKSCGVCQKMSKLNEEFADDVLDLVHQYAQAYAESIIGQNKPVNGHMRPQGYPTIDLTETYRNDLRNQQRILNNEKKGKL